MKSDFEMIKWRLPKDARIYPIADVHYGSISHQKQEWDAFVRMITEDEQAYLILGGDLINNNTRSSVGSPFDDTVRPREQKARMAEYLEPIKGKILCMVSGNHERRSLKDADDDPTYDIACKINIEDVYRPNAAFVRVAVGERNKGKGRERDPLCSYYFAVTHGAGGGIYTGATVNRNERWGNVIDGVDCVIVGHTHKGTVTRPSKIVVDQRAGKVLMREYLILSCCAWQTYGDYALQKMLLPSVTSRPQVIYLNDQQKDLEVRW
jgi:predicted phosphodiesterase